MNLSLLEVFTFVSIVHCFLLGAIILTSRYLRNRTNQYLGLTLLVIGLIGLNNWFWDVGKDPAIIRFFDLFLWQFLYPVYLYLFFVKGIKRDLQKRYKKLLFTPFIVLSLLNIVVSLHNVYGLINIPFLTTETITGFYKVISLLSVIFPLLLLVLSFRLVFLKKAIRDITWLKLFWVFFALIEVYGLVLEFQRFLSLERKPLTYLWVVMSVLLYWLIYVGVYRFKLSNEKYEIRQLLKAKKLKPHAPATFVTEENQYIKELIRLMRDEKLHHNPLLNRELVAETLNISTGYLSQLISATEFNSLSGLISHYRVEDVKKLLKDEDFSNYSLLSIGLEVGFNSKTTFFNTFKRLTGLTPNDYRKQHQ